MLRRMKGSRAGSFSTRQSVKDCCGGAESRGVARAGTRASRWAPLSGPGHSEQRCTTGNPEQATPGCPRPNPSSGHSAFLPQRGEQKPRGIWRAPPGPEGSLRAGSGSRRAGRPRPQCNQVGTGARHPSAHTGTGPSPQRGSRRPRPDTRPPAPRRPT